MCTGARREGDQRTWWSFMRSARRAGLLTRGRVWTARRALSDKLAMGVYAVSHGILPARQSVSVVPAVHPGRLCVQTPLHARCPKDTFQHQRQTCPLAEPPRAAPCRPASRMGRHSAACAKSAPGQSAGDDDKRRCTVRKVSPKPKGRHAWRASRARQVARAKQCVACRTPCPRPRATACTAARRQKRPATAAWPPMCGGRVRPDNIWRMPPGVVPRWTRLGHLRCILPQGPGHG